MINYNILLFKLLIILSCFNLYCADYIITTSGTYILADDLLSTNADSNGAIRISSSFVTLDLNGRFIRQNNATAGANGIVIDAGLTDIVVKNGTIVNFTRCGVTVNSGCSVISLQDLNVENCQLRAVELLGSLNNNITKSRINNCKIFGCCSSASTDNVMTLSVCSDVIISDCVLNNNSASAINLFSVILLDACESCNILGTKIDNNSLAAAPSSGSISCIRLNSTRSCYINFIGRNNSNTSTTGNHMMPIKFTGSIPLNVNNIFDDCILINNSSSTSGVSYGFYVENSYYTLLRNCKSIFNNNSASSQGIGFMADVSAYGATMINCISLANRASGANMCTAFYLGGNYGVMRGCLGAFGTLNSPSASGQVYGVLVSGANNSVVIESDFFANTNTSSDANSSGIRWASGSNNVFVQNVALRNGTTSNTNNIAGASFPAGSRDTTGGSTSMNSPTAPWTNLSIAS